MTRNYRLFAILPAIVLLMQPLCAHAAVTPEHLTLTPPEKMPRATGSLQIVCDRSMNGMSFRVTRIQPEGGFCYYNSSIMLCDTTVLTCPLWEGNYELTFSVPTDSGMLEYTRTFTLDDPDMDPALRFDQTVYTVTLDTDGSLAADAFTESEPVTQERVIRAGCTGTLARREFVLGELNGDGTVNAGDAADLLIASAAAGAGEPSGLTPLQQYEADLNGDGMFNSADASELLIYSASLAAGAYKGDALGFMRQTLLNAENDINSAGNAD